MKKILALILLAFLTAGLFIACNGDAAETVFSGTDSSTLENLFFFKSIAANSSVTLNKTDNPTPIDFIYSTDGEEWKDYTIGQAISLPNIDDTVYFRAKKESGGAFNLNHIPNRAKIVDKNFYSFASEGQVSVSGNIMYLVDPKGKATTMAKSAFSLLFKNNSGLVSAEDLILPALQLSDYCYSEMFSGCSSLTKVPKLPATELKPYCYYRMFDGCSALETAPYLPAQELVTRCYYSMFRNCTSLNYISVNFKEWDSSATDSWLVGVPSTGIIECCLSLIKDPIVLNPENVVTAGGTESTIPNGWTAHDKPIGFVAKQAGSTVTLEKNGDVARSYEYSTDMASWNDYTYGDTITLSNVGDEVFFKLKSSQRVIPSSDNYIHFKLDGKVEVFGNIMFLVDQTGESTSLDSNYAFFCLFSDNETSLISAKDLMLPATTLSPFCYKSMFWGCSALTKAPSLPATTLANSCYATMFSNCSALEAAPKLPATTLADSCYAYMFSDCKSLTETPELLAITLKPYCYQGMFRGCSKLETNIGKISATTVAEESCEYMFQDCTSLTKAPELPATTLANSCYDSMFYGCKELTASPSLPATELKDKCYASMFLNCIKLETAGKILAESAAIESCAQMFKGCTSLTQSPALCATTLAEKCYRQMFYGCTALTTAGDISATVLAPSCCYSMFWGCSALTKAPKLPATTLAKNCYEAMFHSCSALTEAPVLPATTLVTECYSHMFVYCSSLNKIEVAFTDWKSSENCTLNWISGVPSSGTFICPPSTPDNASYIPTGWTVIPMVQGVFSVSATKKVQFTGGNLQATYNSSISDYSWGFAENQYDYIGDTSGNTTIDNQTNGAVVDLFLWSTQKTGNNHGISNDTSGELANFKGWSDLFKDANGEYDYEVLSKDEFEFLLNTRTTSTVGATPNARYVKVKIGTIDGLLIFPDTFVWTQAMGTTPDNINNESTQWTAVNSYTLDNFKTMEDSGCVFLPAAGRRSGKSVNDIGTEGNIWTSSSGDMYSPAVRLGFYNTYISISGGDMYKGYSVRLVKDVPAE